MKHFARILALALALTFCLGCLPVMAEERTWDGGGRTITIAAWWDLYYDSDDESPESNPSYTGDEASQLMFDVVKEIEEKYNVKIKYENLTYTGIQESINESVSVFAPADCDIYMVDLAFALPFVVNGKCLNLKEVLTEDYGLSTHEDYALNYLDTGDDGIYLIYPNAAEEIPANTIPLAYNVQMIQNANLEDPYELWERGEWTWDKFREYLKVLTVDNNGDGVTDVYGLGGWPEDYFPMLMMSNGTYAVAGEKENFSSPEVAEVLQFMQDLSLVDKTMIPTPTENGWDILRWVYRDGKVAFTSCAAWILDANKDYNPLENTVGLLDFDMKFVPWPVGPHGDKETNAGKIASGSYYMIPVGTEDPELVYNVFRDLHDWYHGDTSIRDSEEALNWWYSSTAKDLDLQDHNFDVMFYLGSREIVDNINNLPYDGTRPDLVGLLNGNYTVSQYQETYKQPIQDFLDILNGK